MNLTKVQQALLAPFVAAFPSTQDNDIWRGLIAFANITVNPQPAAVWLAWLFMPSAAQVQTMGPGGMQQYDGLVQVNVNLPEGAGELDSRALIDTILSCYTPGSMTYDGQAVSIFSASPSPGVTSGGYYTIPITIRWRASVRR